MSTKFDFVSTTDKPALLAFSTPEWLEAARTALNELGYKVHTAATHGDFLIRFSQVRYQVVIVEELFAANQPGENLTLQALQRMPMPQRRHASMTPGKSATDHGKVICRLISPVCGRSAIPGHWSNG